MTVLDMEKHMRIHYSKSKECKQCGEVLPSKNKLMEHEVDKHGRDGAFLHRCDICNLSCFDRAKYNAHRASIHGES
jgi:Pyruvate/2-oxoacid:ferredoxin oxidoreductase delta subunit